VTVDLETQVRALADRQEVLEKRQALTEQRVARLSDIFMEIQRDLRTMQRDMAGGFASVQTSLKEVAVALASMGDRRVAVE
jgi:uncharacterized coiled-coil protein SlyX